jgi:hypothetical protein
MLFDPKLHILDRMVATDDLVKPVGQICQPLGLTPIPLTTACGNKCRAQDAKIAQVCAGGGAMSVKFEACLLKEPKKRKADQPTIGYGKHDKTKLVQVYNGLGKTRAPPKKRKKPTAQETAHQAKSFRSFFS